MVRLGSELHRRRSYLKLYRKFLLGQIIGMCTEAVGDSPVIQRGHGAGADLIARVNMSSNKRDPRVTYMGGDHQIVMELEAFPGQVDRPEPEADHNGGQAGKHGNPYRQPNARRTHSHSGGWEEEDSTSSS